jgi:V/A-type H+-transporting ATPase subunit E
MTLDRLVEEIRLRAEEELRTQSALQASEEAAVATDRDARVAAVRDQTQRTAEREIAQERAHRLASAKLQARKLVYEADETRMASALGETRQLLSDYTDSDEYPKVLKRMVAYATGVLGKATRIMGRTEDAAALKKLAGAAFDPTPQSILGGVVAESADGARRLNLSFDELLRLREDRVRQLLSS